MQRHLWNICVRVSPKNTNFTFLEILKVFFMHNLIFFYCKIIRFRSFSFQKHILLYMKKKKITFLHRGGGGAKGISGHVRLEYKLFWKASLMAYLFKVFVVFLFIKVSLFTQFGVKPDFFLNGCCFTCIN